MYDYYASISGNNLSSQRNQTSMLSSGFVDEKIVKGYRRNGNKNNERKKYLTQVKNLKINFPEHICFTPSFENLSDPSWTGLEIDFILKTPWYSKDDKAFHILDNPIRKDMVFGVPFMASSTWKGLLRWSCRMRAGLLSHLTKKDGKMSNWKDPDWIVHFFGNEKTENDEFIQGSLISYPTWFSKIDFEVINPHTRKTRAGTQPIYYEVVPAGESGKLKLLYVSPNFQRENNFDYQKAMKTLIDSIDDLLTIYGFSAKRTSGWGTARIERWGAWKNGEYIEEDDKDQFFVKLNPWLTKGEGTK